MGAGSQERAYPAPPPLPNIEITGMLRHGAHLLLPSFAVSFAMTALGQCAQDFATRHHAAVKQVRKYTGLPYIVHPAAVVEIVRSVHHTPEMLAAAWLHDTVEDTKVTAEEVLQIFGPAVADLGEMLTDISRPADGNRKVRKQLDPRTYCTGERSSPDHQAGRHHRQ